MRSKLMNRPRDEREGLRGCLVGQVRDDIIVERYEVVGRLEGGRERGREGGREGGRESECECCVRYKPEMLVHSSS